MKIVLFDGIKSTEIQSFVDHYGKLTRRYRPLEIVQIKDKSQKKINTEKLKNFLDKEFCILLSERGTLMDTPSFSQKLKNWDLEGKKLCFIVGNAFGFEQKLEQKADFLLSLSPLTMAHEMIIGSLMEQIYRCYNILAGGNYHK